MGKIEIEISKQKNKRTELRSSSLKRLTDNSSNTSNFTERSKYRQQGKRTWPRDLEAMGPRPPQGPVQGNGG